MSPANDFLRSYTVAELERIAQDVLKQIEDGFCIPIDIDYLIETQPNVDLDYYPALRDNYNLDGMVGNDPEADEIVIYIDEKLATKENLFRRYRMTVAEELAHLILHRKAIEQVQNPDDFQKLHHLPNWYVYERNAKRLAAMILMPYQYILNDTRQWFHDIVSNPQVAASIKGIAPEMIINLIASKLADRYQVSQQSMKIRLNEWPINVTQKIGDAMKNNFDYLD